MSISSTKHDAECREAVNQLISNWRNGKDQNNFIDSDVAKNEVQQRFPSPDAGFFSAKTQSLIALEYKPAERETKRGILTGLGQSIAYLTASAYSASVLVVPEKIDDFDISGFLKKIFDEQIYDKLPIALYSFKNGEPSNIVCLKNISNRLSNSSPKNPKAVEKTYWAFWRETYPSYIFQILNIAASDPSTGTSRVEKIWEKYFFDVYRNPPEADQTLELLENTKIYNWEKSEPFIWLAGIKKQLKKAVDEDLITQEEAIARIKWAAAKNRSELDKYYPILKRINSRFEERPKWLPAHNKDNTYVDIKKNTRLLPTHLNLWDNSTWSLTEVGHKFLERSKNGADALEDLASLLLINGKWSELINDISTIQNNFSPQNKINLNVFLKELKNEFANRGYIGLNELRKSTGTRKWLQAERQVMRRLNLIETSKGNQTFFEGVGFKFKTEKIRKLSDIYDQHYAKIYKEAA